MRASSVATAVSLLLVLAIVLGSRVLRNFDAALLPYAVATVFLAFGVAYRYMLWLSAPASRCLLRQARRGVFFRVRALFSRASLSRARHPLRTPARRRARAETRATARAGGTAQAPAFTAQEPVFRARPRARRIAHQLLLWGSALAVLITFPLTWGWISFTATSAAGPGYELRVWGYRLAGFDALSFPGWALFHALDLAAVLVIAGAGYFLWRRMRDRGALTGQRFAYDLVPLLALIVVAVTGLLLTFSSLVLRGGGYEFLALLHMASVVFALIYLPFGKFFHVVQRPAATGMRRAAHPAAPAAQDGAAVLACRRCEEPIGAAPAIEDLRTTMRELDLGFDEWAEYCPRCKRQLRGAAYLTQVKKGYV
ncbi:MFS transporter [Streptomyces pathocidini]